MGQNKAEWVGSFVFNKVRIQRFKSFEDTTVSLPNPWLLVGPNGGDTSST